MRLKSLELSGFKSFAKKTSFIFDSPVTSIVGPNGSGKSNVAEAFRWVLGERSMKSLRSGRGEDLIFNGSGQVAKQNRAAVTLIFDNQDRKFDIDFDEVAVGREVHRDGTNIYKINNSQVRHRDIIELLANVSLGSSDHYIVNQGDADRVLLANPSERRTMLEDALGLRLYQWKIEESAKKLEKTEENMKQVESLRRELAPHLRYLQKQVDKIAEADRLRAELKTLGLAYLKREDDYLNARRAKLTAAKAEPEAKLQAINERLSLITTAGGQQNDQTGPIHERRRRADDQINQARSEQEELGRRLGRLEGLIEVKQAAVDNAGRTVERDFSYPEVREFHDQLMNQLAGIDQEADPGVLKNILNQVRKLVGAFLERGRNTQVDQAKKDELNKLQAEKREVDTALTKARQAEEAARAERAAASKELDQALAAAQEADKERLSLKAEASEWQGRLNAALSEGHQLELETENFKRELEEITLLVDQEIKRYRDFALPDDEEVDRAKQEERRRQLERLKIKLEDMGVDHGDTMKEYQETLERDQFLEKELADLTQSEVSIKQVVEDLRQKIETEFKTGLVRINDKFGEFFGLMFGGGQAKLSLIKLKSKSELMAEELGADGEENLSTIAPRSGAKEEGETTEGLDISVSLPRKKIRGLEMLSGGERALTSIALLFAMSQVNPPPFLILDETDAALDEANSRKYGEMVSNLAAHSQLILITHNRETMSQAGVLYGVTMGGDGVSKLLSIKFDEATVYAK